MNGRSLFLPLLGMAGGSALMIVGSSSLTATWLDRTADEKIRIRNGAVAVVLVGLGTALQALSSAEFARAV